MDDPMERLMLELEERFENVASMVLTEGVTLDESGRGGLAFIVGRDSDNALVFEATVAGDGAEATASIWAISNGERKQLPAVELDGQWFFSLRLIP